MSKADDEALKLMADETGLSESELIRAAWRLFHGAWQKDRRLVDRALHR